MIEGHTTWSLELDFRHIYKPFSKSVLPISDNFGLFLGFAGLRRGFSEASAKFSMNKSYKKATKTARPDASGEAKSAVRRSETRSEKRREKKEAR